MERLERQASELVADGDSGGAALAIGKAAMMAGIMARQESEKSAKDVFLGIEALFRTQEHGYRAIALFEQAGGQPPAPTGACQLLSLATQHSHNAQTVFSNMPISNQSDSTHISHRYFAQAQEWTEIIRELQTDFACSALIPH